MKRLPLVLVFVLSGFVGMPAAKAATIIYNSNTNGSSLLTAGNWNPNSAVPGTSDEALFTTSAPANLATTSGNSTFGDLVWGTNSSSTISITTTGSSSRTLTLSGGGGFTEAIARGGVTNDLIVMGTSATSNTLTFAGNVNASPGAARLSLVLGIGGNFNVVNAGATLDVGVVVSGAFNLTKTGSGVLTLSGVNTFGGSGKNFTLSAGTVNINNASALGNSSNTFVVSGGTINNTSGSAITTGNYAQTWNGDFAFTGSNALNLGTGAVTLGASRQVTVNGSTLIVGGAIGGNGLGLTKAGSGTLALSGANTYSGGTTVSGGTLSVTGSGTLGSTSGAVSIGASGTLSVGSGVTLGNAINVTGALNGSGLTSVFSGTVSGNGTLGGTMKITGTLAPGNSPGIINVAANGSLTFGSGSTYSWELGSLTDNLTGTAGTDFDQLKLLSSTSALDATLGTLVPSFGSTPAPNSGNAFWNSAHTWTIVDNTAGGTITGTFLATNSWSSFGTFSLGATTLSWIPSTTAIPEPATGAALLGVAALAGAMVWRRRRLP